MRRLPLLLALFLLGLPAAAQTASFQGLGDLPGGYSYSVPYGVSADGSVVVGMSSSGEGGSSSEAFRWTTGGGIVGLGGLPGGRPYSIANGVSADGSIVVGNGTNADGYSEPFQWTAGAGMTSLGTFTNDLLSAYGVSADGSVVVGEGFFGGSSEAFRWRTGGELVGLGYLPGAPYFSRPTDVSADGSVVIGESSSPNGSNEAFRWTATEGMVYLGPLPGRPFTSLANGVSADGSVVVGQAGGSEAFRWTAGEGMVGLGTLPGYPSSGAQDVSADGSVIVGYSGGSDRSDAFRWTAANGMQNLNSLLVEAGVDLTGWHLDNAIRTSDDGAVIVGIGRNRQGQVEAWRAVLPRVVSADPAPESGLNLALTASPNPARNRATFRFTLSAAGPVRLALVDALGRTVAAVDAGERGAGEHAVAVDTSRLPAGVYVARLNAGGTVRTARVTVVR